MEVVVVRNQCPVVAIKAKSSVVVEGGTRLITVMWCQQVVDDWQQLSTAVECLAVITLSIVLALLDLK